MWDACGNLPNPETVWDQRYERSLLFLRENGVPGQLRRKVKNCLRQKKQKLFPKPKQRKRDLYPPTGECRDVV